MYIVVLVTASCKKESAKIAQALIRNKLVACVNIVDKIESFFWWEKKIEQAREVLLLVKSKKEKFKSIVKLVKSLHSYEVPEIIALPLISGEKKYLKWIDGALK